MNSKASIRRKSILIIICSIVLTTCLYLSLNKLYLFSQEQYIKSYLSRLLISIGEDIDNVEEAKQWTTYNLNLQIHILDSVEELMAHIPSSIEKSQVLSDSDRKKLEKGQTVINQIKTSDFALNLLLFIYPVIEDNEIKNLLFLHAPINNLKGKETVFSIMTILLALISAGIMLFATNRVFSRSYKQLLDIQQGVIEVSKGNFDIKLYQDNNDEVGEITQGFNAMSNNLKKQRKRVMEFMEDFSHEIKTPLSLVKSYNQAMMDQLIQDQNEQQRYYQLIDRETSRMQKLIQNYLDFTKLDAQSVELVRNPIVFAQSLEDIMMKYELVFKEKNAKLNMELDYEVIVHADEDRLEQIIQNIIQNAIKYSKENPCISIIMERKAQTCVLVISDNGIGIDEENLSIITNRFVRVNKVRSRNESGTGLGLSIVEKLMNLHGGEMKIESQWGVGTTIKLEFPIMKHDDYKSS